MNRLFLAFHPITKDISQKKKKNGPILKRANQNVQEVKKFHIVIAGKIGITTKRSIRKTRRRRRCKKKKKKKEKKGVGVGH